MLHNYRGTKEVQNFAPEPATAGVSGRAERPTTHNQNRTAAPPVWPPQYGL